MTIEADKTQIRALIAGIDKAHHARDAAAIVEPYTSDALIFDLAPPLARKMLKGEVASWLATWEGPVERESRDFVITLEGDLAFATGYFGVRATSKEDGQRASWWCRATLGLRRIEGAWKIVHEHISVPFSMDGNFLAVLDLQP